MKYALMDNEGQLLEKGKRPSADNLDDFVAALYEVGDQYCLDVAVMILNLQTVINGEKVVIGGGISAQEILIEEIRRQFGEILQDNPILGQQVIPPEIVAAKFRNDTNLYGALFALLQGMQK